MTRLPLARALVVALVGLTAVLAVTAALAVASLYESRQDFADALSRTYGAEVSVANLLAAGVIEEAILRGGGDAGARGSAAAAYGQAAAAARAAVQGDRVSRALVVAQIAAQARARSTRGEEQSENLREGRRSAADIVTRQQARREAARAQAERDSRRATTAAGAAGGLALLFAVALVTALIGSVRRPLDALVRATSFLARGDVRVRVREEGPAELRELAGSFNTMAADLASAREQIEAERRRLSTVVESLGDALVVVGGDGRVALTNPRAADLVPELGVGGNSQASGSPLPRLADALAGELQISHRERVLAVTAAHLGEREEDGVVWTIRDVSERARLERMKSEFVATASHELRSPLTSIKGFAELLLRSEGLEERQREFAETVVLSTNRLADLVNDLLDVTRIEVGQLQLSRRPTDVADAVGEIVALMAPRIEDRRQRLEVQIALTTPSALADPARLRQIITNLVTNAHLYTPEGGNILVRVCGEDGHVVLEVVDDGQGMTHEELEHLYDRFYRGERYEQQPGTGLGMSIVRSLVDLHKGTIEVESAPGKGSTFRVRIPSAPAQDDDGLLRLALRGKRVLIVEDDPAIAALISEQLTPHEVEAVIVGSGEEALARLRSDGEPFDAMTLDILLTGMSGFEVLHKLRSDPEFQRIPVVVVSVLSGKAALAGEWVVSKPIDEAELVDALGSAILAGRARVLVVARTDVRGLVGPRFDELGIEYDWATNGAQAARLCESRRYEVALVDAGMHSPQAVLEQLTLRGRRLRRSVIVFSAGEEAPGMARLDGDPMSVGDATAAVLAALGTPKGP